MASYISKDGVWYPMKEKVGLVNRSKKSIEINGQKIAPGEPFVYDGPDRGALFALWEAGELEVFGEDFRNSPDFLEIVRNRGFDSVEKYLKAIGYNKEKSEQMFNEKASVVIKHELPEKVRMIDVMGGGQDFSGGGLDKKGGFGDQPAIM